MENNCYYVRSCCNEKAVFFLNVGVTNCCYNGQSDPLGLLEGRCGDSSSTEGGRSFHKPAEHSRGVWRSTTSHRRLQKPDTFHQPNDALHQLRGFLQDLPGADSLGAGKEDGHAGNDEVSDVPLRNVP